MLKLRTLLLYNYPYYIIVVIALIYLFLNLYVIPNESNYEDINNIAGVIKDIEIVDDKVSFIIYNKEKIKCNYYLKDNKTFNYNLGDKILVSGEESVLVNNTVLNTFNYKQYLNYQKIFHILNVDDIKLLKKNKNIFYSIKSGLLKLSDKSEAKSYIKTLIFGDTTLINDNVIDSFRSNGISHLFAVSGLHVNIFLGILFKILSIIKISENKRYVCGIIFLLFFMFLTGYPMSIVRAGIFSILSLIDKIYYFYVKKTNILLLTLAIIIFINPLSVINIGFYYSYIISLILLIFQEKINKLEYKYFKNLLFVSLISFLVSIPITINSFYQVNFLSIIYNLFFIPYVCYLIMPGAIICYIFPFLSEIYKVFIYILEKFSLFLTKLDFLQFSFSKISIIFIIIYYILIFFVISKLVKKKFIYIFIIIISFVVHYFYPLFIKDNYYLMFDIGQGDSSIIHINNNTTLIDTGGVLTYDSKGDSYFLSKNKIIPYLKSVGIKKINNLVLTHGDYDHMGEAINLVENFKVEKVIFNCGKYNDLENELIKVLNKKKIPYYSCIEELNIDNNKLYFLKTRDYGNENDNSNVIYTEFNNYKFLFMGDAGVEVEEDIIEKYNLQDIDVLKVGHHGSKTSSSKDFINESNPKYSLISVGKDNKFGHPNENVLNNLINSKIYRTDQDGSIMFKIRDNKLKIETCTP